MDDPVVRSSVTSGREADDMRKGDFLWLLVLLAIAAFLVLPATHEVFVASTAAHPYLVGFAKFFVLATMGELLALRIVTGGWVLPKALVQRAVIWGFLGMVIVLVFDVYAGGVMGSLKKGLLPGADSRLAFAFFVSTIMNLTFAPAMMLTHRMTDTWLDLKSEGKGTAVADIVARIDWHGFVSFVLLKTIPCFWIPAHTITFLLPPEYRVLAAALLSIALGAILAFAKKKSPAKA
jgi:hypothetical protein